MTVSNSVPPRFKAAFLMLLIALIIALSMISCKGCNKPPAPVVNIHETIQANAKPVEDSLRHEVALLKDSIAYLKTKVQKSEVKKDIAREKKQEASAKVNAAEQKGDSLAIITSLKEQVIASEQYIRQADEQATDQGEIIVKQEKVITKQLSDLSIQDGKFKDLVTAFNNLQSQFGQAINDLKKSDKKNAVLKFFVKTLGIITAAAVAVLAILIL